MNRNIPKIISCFYKKITLNKSYSEINGKKITEIIIIFFTIKLKSINKKIPMDIFIKFKL